jgi:hypothetical protein
MENQPAANKKNIVAVYALGHAGRTLRRALKSLYQVKAGSFV